MNRSWKRHPPIKELSAKVESFRAIAEELLTESGEFAAVNLNIKRILASVEMLRINLEAPEA